MSIKSIPIKSAFLSLMFVIAACSSSGNKEVSKVAAQEPVVKISQEQRPSEINQPVKGKITRTGEVYLLRGLANVFSRGMDTLGVKMIRKGLDARVYNHAAWRELADNILLRAKKKQVSYPIVIMGHSLGANASTTMAKYLGDRGVKVQYVVAFDPTVTTAVGKNVNRVINFYLPNDNHSNIVKKAPGFRGVVKNINVRGVRGLTHTTVEKDAKFHSEVIQRTLTYTKKRRKKKRA
ncbi:MAG: thioesterase domain-containing protein [Pseudomonadota bacterium]